MSTDTLTVQGRAAISKADAEALWARVREAFVNAERAVIDVIEAEAWVPLGYATFAAAWADRMKGVRLATDAMKIHVVYALLDAGETPQSAYTILAGSGVGPDTIKALAKKRALGIPPQAASLRRPRREQGADVYRVRQHYRNMPREARTLHIELTPDEYIRFRDLCDARGRSVVEEGANALRTWLKFMETHDARQAA